MESVWLVENSNMALPTASASSSGASDAQLHERQKPLQCPGLQMASARASASATRQAQMRSGVEEAAPVAVWLLAPMTPAASGALSLGSGSLTPPDARDSVASASESLAPPAE